MHCGGEMSLEKGRHRVQGVAEQAVYRKPRDIGGSAEASATDARHSNFDCIDDSAH